MKLILSPTDKWFVYDATLLDDDGGYRGSATGLPADLLTEQWFFAVLTSESLDPRVGSEGYEVVLDGRGGVLARAVES